MDPLAFLSFAPVPVRVRHDGWTPARQRQFVALLAKGLRPEAAARRLGMSRQTAYALRGKPGGKGFAAAWDAALDFARRMRIAAEARNLPAAAPRPRPTREWIERLYGPGAAEAVEADKAAR